MTFLVNLETFFANPEENWQMYNKDASTKVERLLFDRYRKGGKFKSLVQRLENFYFWKKLDNSMILWKGNCTYWPYGTFYIIHTMIISNNSLSSLLLLHTIGSYIIKNSFINEKTKQKSMCIINWKMFQQLLNTIEHKKENKTKKQIIKTEIFSS